MEIQVKKTGGSYNTVQAAIDAVPFGDTGVISIGPGVYREKIFTEGKDIILKGAGSGQTVIEFGDGAFDELEDGSKRGTFRSYTAFLGGGKVMARDLTVRNTAGDGAAAGQAIAIYADADICFFENVRIEGCQDTLFCAPLPEKERQKNGFIGPRAHCERRLTKQYYKNCVITGDVDFIFGGADAVFDDCEIICNNRQPCYVTAASGSSKDLGFVFRRCRIHGSSGSQAGSVYLGRPWRDEARTVFLDCITDEIISPLRFSGWGASDKQQPDTYYGEFGTCLVSGEAVDLSCKNSWVKEIDAKEADKINRLADEIARLVTGQDFFRNE